MTTNATRRPALAATILAALMAFWQPAPPVCLAWSARQGGNSLAADEDPNDDPVRLDPVTRHIKAFIESVSPSTRPAAPASRPGSPEEADTPEGCLKLYMQGKYGASAEAWRRLLDTREHRISAAVGLAEALAAVGKHAEALDALQKVRAEAEDRADWHVALAEQLHTVGRYDEALAHAARAHELRETWAPAILARGWVLETLGRKQEAAEVYKTMSRTVRDAAYRSDARSLVALGRIMDRCAVLTGQRASEQASNILHNYFQEAYLKADPGYWPAHVAAGMFLLSKHRPETAAQEFALAAKLNKNVPDAFVGMGAIELGRWRFEQCLSHVDKALHINPEHADALLLKAACLMQWRKFDQAPPVVERVLKTNPNHLEALSLMAAAHVRADEPAKAEPFVERVRKINPSYAGLPLALAEWLAAGRRFEQAEKHYRQAMELAPELGEPITGLGRLYMQTGDEDKAIEVLQKAHRIDDFRSDVVNFLNLLNRMKKYDVRETEHFVVKVDGRYDAILLDQVAEYMERIHKEVASDFGHCPPHKTIIEFFPSHADFSVRITGKGWIGTVGACTGRVIALVAPDVERSQFGTHNWATVLRHEYAHAVTLSATAYRIPHWFTEACAVWQQPDKRNYKFVQMLVDATRNGRLFPMKELDWGFIRPQRAGDRSLAYAQSEWVMEHIIETKGYETIVRMLRAFRDGQTQAEVFEKVIGIPEKDFDKGFGEWAKATVKRWGFNPEPPPDYAQAVKEAKDRPDDAQAQAALAVASYYRRRLGDAEQAARKALELDPRNTRALAVLAVVLESQKNYDEAVAAARRLEEIDHTTHFAPKVLAQCHIARKHWAEAIVALELLQQRQPLDPYSYEQLALIYNQLGQPEKALPNLIHLHRHTMTDPKYARQIAETYRALGQDEQALAYFEEITHINPYQPNAYEAMAAIYRSAEQYDKAVAAIEKVCLLQPESADAWAKAAMMRYLAGRAARDADQLLRARQAAEKAVELDSESRAKEVLERIDAAIAELEKPT